MNPSISPRNGAVEESDPRTKATCMRFWRERVFNVGRSRENERLGRTRHSTCTCHGCTFLDRMRRRGRRRLG